MTRIVPLKPWHLRLIEPQPEQELASVPQLNEGFGAAVIAAGRAWACVDAERVYCAAGFVFDDGAAKAWAIVSRFAGRRMAAITRAARREIARLQMPVEAYVRDEFAAGERWAALLGLTRETGLVGPNGTFYGKWVR